MLIMMNTLFMVASLILIRFLGVGLFYSNIDLGEWDFWDFEQVMNILTLLYVVNAIDYMYHIINTVCLLV